MKFYRSTNSVFSTVASKCQDSFKGICTRSSTTLSSVSIPAKQCMTMEVVKREHVQMLGVSLFLKTLEKCATGIEDIIHSSQLGDERSKELDKILSFIQIQYSCLGSVDKALEMVTDSSMTMACNLQLARRDTTLKQCAPQLHEHDRNRLRGSGFMSVDLFSPVILNAVEKKLEKERSHKRQKLDVKPIFQSKKPQHSSNSHSYDHLMARTQEILLFVTLRASNNRGGHGGRSK